LKKQYDKYQDYILKESRNASLEQMITGYFFDGGRWSFSLKTRNIRLFILKAKIKGK